MIYNVNIYILPIYIAYNLDYLRLFILVWFLLHLENSVIPTALAREVGKLRKYTIHKGAIASGARANTSPNLWEDLHFWPNY